jgi:hypothetical protein
MAVGPTTTGALADSLPIIKQSARVVRPIAGVAPRLVDRRTLGTGEGLDWNEVSISQIAAQDISETTKLENHQQLIDSLLQVRPSQVGLSVKVTDKARNRISPNVAALIGTVGQQAMNTKKDKNILAIGSSATTDLGTAGNSMASGLVAAGSARITGNTTEQGTDMPKYVLATSFHVKDLQDEIVSGVGTYPIPAGLTEETFRRGFSGTLFNAEVFIDDNITVDSADDAIAMVFGRDAIVHLEAGSPRAVTVRDESFGGGADILYMYDDYASGIRQQTWLYAITADSTAPTS